MKPIIYLDMDGVLADFFTPALQLCEVDRLPATRPLEYNIVPWINAVREEDSLVTLTDKEVWDRIAQHPGFWQTLPKYEWADELIDFLSYSAELHIVSWPQPYSSCYAEKFAWLRDNVKRQLPLILMKDKHLLAKPNTCLIDDCPSNATKFIDCGGYAMQFPQPWNKNHDVQQRISYVKVYVNTFVKFIT